MSTRRRKVFVVSKGFHDWQKAAKFGDVVFLSNSSMNRVAVSGMMRKFLPILQEQSQPEDIIVISGLSVMNSLACAIFAMLHQKLTLLLYDGDNERYILREVPLDMVREQKGEINGNEIQ
jgi:hypothetical protein